MSDVGSVGARRQVGALALAVAGTLVLVSVLAQARSTLNLVSDALVFIVLVVGVSLVGGIAPALLAAALGFVALNYWFTPPFHTLTVRDPNNLVALIGFALVAAMVSWVVDLAARRASSAAAAAELEAGNRLRTALLAAVGHDLRTPLAAAKAVVSGLRNPGDLTAADRSELLETADVSLDRLSGVIDNLLDMSRLQAGGTTTHLAPTPIEDVVARALDDVRLVPGPVLVEVPDSLPLVVTDAGLLERVIVNLIANALRYSPADRPPVVVAVALRDRVELRVVDRGPGIPVSSYDSMFLPFQRLGDTDAGSGIGLGLAVARGLVEAMGGTLRPEKTPGGGLTMVASLPASSGEPAP